MTTETQTAFARIDSLTVDIATSARHRSPRVRVLDHLDLELSPGEATVLVGESGCGKSMVGAALCGLLPPGTTAQGTVVVDGAHLRHDSADWNRVRGSVVGLVPQAPSTSFTPVRTLRSQLAEVVTVLHSRRSAEQLCDLVELPREALDLYPHELSGGMAQRAAIAAAVAGEPRLLIADEPTSALDPDLAHRIWELLADIALSGAAVLAITHDLDSLRRAALDASIAVMRHGRVIAQRRAADLLTPTTLAEASARAATIVPETADDDAYLDNFFAEVR